MRLTLTQRRLLTALRDFLSDHGVMPTARQLMRAARMESADAVREQLGGLLLRGVIVHDDTRPGGIRITADLGERP